jgi:hypothetical protein
MKFEWAANAGAPLHSTIQLLRAQKKPGGENSFSPRVEVIDWNYEKLRSRYRDIWKLVFLFLRGRLFLGGLLSFFLSCHID